MSTPDEDMAQVQVVLNQVVRHLEAGRAASRVLFQEADRAIIHQAFGDLLAIEETMSDGTDLG